MKPLIVFHFPCLDGFTSAWVAKNYFDSRGLQEGYELYPATYGNDPPDVTGKFVYMIDFSYKRPVMQELLKTAGMIIHLDHHQSSIQDLEGLEQEFPDNYRPKFDIGRSGAGLAWDYFNFDKPRPKLVDYVEDRDIWAWKLPNSREINATIGSYDMTFENWDALSNMDMHDTINQGLAINRQIDRWIKEITAVNTKYMVIGGFKVPVLNLPYFLSSEAGHYLAQQQYDNAIKFNKIPRFAATYSDGSKDRKFSLRSVEEGMDVSKIAEKYGGGGHKHAAGFRMDPGWEGDNK